MKKARRMQKMGRRREVIERRGRWMTGMEGTWQVLKKVICVEYEEDADDVEGDGISNSVHGGGRPWKAAEGCRRPRKV